MEQVKDLVCGMKIDRGSAAGEIRYGSEVYYFCSDECLREFRSDPDRYIRDVERHEPPYTKSGPLVAPKFGSAASGGLENEPAPEMHDRK